MKLLTTHDHHFYHYYSHYHCNPSLSTIITITHHYHYYNYLILHNHPFNHHISIQTTATTQTIKSKYMNSKQRLVHDPYQSHYTRSLACHSIIYQSMKYNSQTCYSHKELCYIVSKLVASW